MTTLFSAPTRLEAWIAAVEHLLPRKHDLNIVLSISSPDSDRAVAGAARARVEKFYAAEGEPPLHAIAG